MSHNVAIKGVAIKSLSALKTAISVLRVEQGIPVTFHEGTTHFRTYYGQDDRCDHMIDVAGANHQIGVKKNADGEYQLVFDPYSSGGKGIGSFLGVPPDPKVKVDVADFQQHNAAHAVGKLTQMYTVCVTEETLREDGMSVERMFNEQTGNYDLVAEYI